MSAALQLLEEPDSEQHDAASPSADVVERLVSRRVSERAKIVRFPLRFTTSGARRGSRRYLTVPVDVEGLGFTDFCLDAGTWSALITPEFRARLGFSELDGAAVRALNSYGPTIRQRVPLPEMWLGTHRLPQLHAYVSRLPAAHRKEVGGLLGVKVLRRFDVDINFDANEVVLHPAGHAAVHLLDTRGLKAVACKYTKAGLVCMPVSINGSAPILGILDLSAALSIMNWEAAALVGMQCNKGSASSSPSSSSSSRSGGSSGSRNTSSSETSRYTSARRDASDGSTSSSNTNASAASKVSSSSSNDTGSVSSSSAIGKQPDTDTDADISVSSSMEEHVISSSEASASSDGNYGYFGLLKINREPELIRPSTPHHRPPQQGAHSTHASLKAAGTMQPGKHVHTSSNASSSHSGGGSSASSSSSSSGITSSMPMPHIRLPPDLRDPKRPSTTTSSSSSSTNSSASQQIRRRAPPPPPQRRLRPRPIDSDWADDDGSSDPNIVRLQVHKLPSSKFRVKLGLDRLGGSMVLKPPPAQVAVSALRGLQQLGLAGRPAMVIGHDIWARRRVVLSVKAGVLYMADEQ